MIPDKSLAELIDYGKERTVALARCEEQGPQPAQQLANDMIKDLSPSLLLVVGIAGGVPGSDLTLGDVVISSRIHDFGISAQKPGKIEWDMRGGIHPYVSDIVASLPLYETQLEGWNAADSLRVPRPTLEQMRIQVVERSLAWIVRWRRLCRDHEGLPESSEAFITLSTSSRMLTRLAP